MLFARLKNLSDIVVQHLQRCKIKKSQMMKNFKHTAIIFIALGGTSVAHAQDTTRNESKTESVMDSRDAKRKIIFAVKAGVNRSNVYDEQGQDFVADPKTGFAGGVYMAIPLGRFVGFQPEVLISQKGFSSTGKLQNDSYTLERTSTYLDIPLQLQLKPFRFLSIVAGIQYAYLLNQNDKITFGSNSIERSEDFNNDNIRKNIFGAVGGVDFNIQHLVLSGRAGWDLTANRGDGSSYTPRYKNLWLQATVGFRFY